MSAQSSLPRIVIAGVSSGSGKTTFMVGLGRALTRRGLRVATFKTGPDYLDPSYHARATARSSQNLDGWMMGRETVQRTFLSASREADIALIEGVMGLFDGVSAESGEGSTAELAKWLGAPVLLVVDSSGMARTLAAVVHGCATFDAQLKIAGVLANRVGSRSHLELLTRAVAAVPVVGGLPKEPALSFAERHLGLFTATEDSVTEAQLDAWADKVEQWCDVECILSIAQNATVLRSEPHEREAVSPSCRIGYALDAAFHFYYDDNLRRLEALGATLVPFSPVGDRSLPDVDGLYLGGGYPELHAQALSDNRPMRVDVARFAEKGGPIYGECGGLMYLCDAIRTLDGASYPMVGLIRGEAVMHPRLQSLGYVEVATTAQSILGGPGVLFRGHQFRYSELRNPSESASLIYHVTRRRNGAVEREGYARGTNVVGTYIHAHWASNPQVAANFVESCANFALSHPGESQ